MKEYGIVMAATMVLTWIKERTFVVAPGTILTKRKDRSVMFFVFVILALFIGLRTHYNDTYIYKVLYNNGASFPDFWIDFQWRLGGNPGFNIVNAWLRTLGVSDQGFVFFWATIATGCLVWFLNKYSTNLPLSFFLLFTTNAYLISAAAVKQSIAIAFGLFAIHFALRKNWVLYAIFIIVASWFHQYALIFLFVPLLMFKPWSRRTYVFLVLFLCAGILLESLLGTIVDVTSMLGGSYDENELVGEGINSLRVLVCNAPLLLSFLYRKTIFQKEDRIGFLMLNLAMLNGAIMFVGLFGTAIYFSRLASYFTFAQCLALPWLLGQLPRPHRRFFTGIMIVGYVGFFVYANMISQSFDSNFSRITFIQYLTKYVFNGVG